MRTSVRTAAAVASAASLALLLTACGGDGKSEETGKDAPKPSATSPAPVAKALSAAELEKLVVEQADLKGHKVQKAEAGDVVKSSDVATDKAACKPIADAMSFIAPGSPAATVQRKAVAIPGKNATQDPTEAALGALGAPVTAVTLGSYDGAGAQDALALLRTAGTECAGGFTVKGGGEETKVSKVAPDSVTAGEENVAFTVTSDMEGEPFVSKLVVFRKGNNLAALSTISLAGEVKEQPKAIIDAQVAKLG
ncbi:hypothetical protein [Streptomyces sp. NBC_01353]|uniref:hypothetical protein n=1 Tax=Streptomyces sp. NBC_01353 TaxID=2903835 RepID=UPI002E2F0551|nr:hypothetical protein [Streptomyces sp. NBC_01353]